MGYNQLSRLQFNCSINPRVFPKTIISQLTSRYDEVYLDLNHKRVNDYLLCQRLRSIWLANPILHTDCTTCQNSKQSYQNNRADQLLEK